MYTLAGIANPETGWGIAGESFETLNMLDRYGEDTWFKLGDRDLATHMLRTNRLRSGEALTEVTAALSSALGVESVVLPMSDDPVSTVLDTPEGRLEFQEYFVRRGQRDEVLGVELRGIEDARPTGAVLAAISGADAIVICPSNPVVSVGPILALPGMREALAHLRPRRWRSARSSAGGRSRALRTGCWPRSATRSRPRAWPGCMAVWWTAWSWNDRRGRAGRHRGPRYARSRDGVGDARRARSGKARLGDAGVRRGDGGALSSTASVSAVVPVKDLQGTKSRLAPILDPGARAGLTLYMMGRVVAAIREAGIEDVCVVSPDRIVLNEAQRRGAKPLVQESRGLNPALEEGRRRALELGAPRCWSSPPTCRSSTPMTCAPCSRRPGTLRWSSPLTGPAPARTRS